MKKHKQDGSQAHTSSSTLLSSAMLLRLPEVCKRVGLSRSEIYRRMHTNRFSRAIAVSQRITAWSAAEVAEWVATQIAGRDQGKE